MRSLYFIMGAVLVAAWAGMAPAADCGCNGCPLVRSASSSTTTTTAKTTRTAAAPVVVVQAARQPVGVRRTVLREFEGPAARRLLPIRR